MYSARRIYGSVTAYSVVGFTVGMKDLWIYVHTHPLYACWTGSECMLCTHVESFMDRYCA